MSLLTDYKSVLKAVSQWPAERRASLAHELLELADAGAEGQSGRRRVSFSKALGLGRGKGALPTDEEVRRWIDEHRMEKYGE